MNPYATYLEDQDPLRVIAETHSRLSALLDALGRDGADRVLVPGKWSARQILCHLADTELAFAFRLRQALAEPHHVIQPFDQDKWAAIYDAFEARAAVEVFGTVRKWNITLIKTIPPAAVGITFRIKEEPGRANAFRIHAEALYQSITQHNP